MDTVIIKGILTEDGKIIVDLPSGWKAGEIEIEIPVEDTTWTEEELAEIAELMKSNPRPTSEIQTGGWEDMGIEDSVEFVEEMRRKRREKSKW
jgi:hypothetical protein